MKIILIVPSYVSIYGSYRGLYKNLSNNPPLNLSMLASALQQGGHDVTIIDAESENISNAHIVEMIACSGVELLGLTATSIDFLQVKQCAGLLKASMPSVPIIIGGTHVNIFGKEVLVDNPEFDYACIGDGEDLILELANSLQQKTGVEAIKGLVYRKDSLVVENPPRQLEMNIDRYPLPARHLLKNDLYFRAVPYKGFQPSACVLSMRGCPYTCTYCAVDKIHGGTKVRIRSAGNVLQELRIIVQDIGIKHVVFNDDTLTFSKERIYDICEGIKRMGLKFTWEGSTRADRIDIDLLKAMKHTGLVRILYGIESGNQEILEVIQKKETLEQIKEAFWITKEVGIVARGSILIGSPYETRKTVGQTFRFVRSLKGLDQVVVNILQPYPGTKVRDMIMKGEGGASFVKNTQSHHNLRRFGSASVSVNDLTPRLLILLQKWGFLSFYLRPRTVLRNIQITGFRAFIRLASSFMMSILKLENEKD